MRQFRGVSEKEIREFFHIPPSDFSKNLERKKLGMAMGAALYLPGSMPNFSVKLNNKNLKNLTSTIICLEDAVSDSELLEAELNVVNEFKLIERNDQNSLLDTNEIPLLFVRIRNVQQLEKIANLLGSAIRYITGFVFPKCTSNNARNFFLCLQNLNLQHSIHLYALPILETKEIIYTETREQELSNLYTVFKQFEDLVLTIRVGATDFTSLFSQRRPGNRTIYDLLLITNCLTDILNKFNRKEDNFVVSGPVYEYFESQDSFRLFTDANSIEAILWNEVQLDVLNGFYGKTCIHPSQIDIVNSVYIVPKELFEDACLIVENNAETNGVLRSPARNKMNEVKPHYSWAMKIIAQAEIYGVLKDNVTSFAFLQYIKNL
ncbi:HpcH/HpaI aldolase/citrate lyase family protein [Psychrobacillus sp. INOP01]|uniref:HpcH/HpaI aldolase/citrate lyase family protein n=1 Tax=Psychrobacillus sp. INOP01 TaxID=2829187 RepID=UPI001BAAE3C4|nr:HpcH/HpaI aldolase/citrate lyase family protein [Psychrobacillus sp. INOP01]QUG40221.1 HpcH/HpaI aldolase/citrate lyase family protein [Psychrobacillus sp. INOP01]